MVDARLPAEWLGSIRIDKLSDRAFRILAGALMWCNGQGTDGAVPARYTKYLHPDGDDQDAFDELEASGLWSRVEDGYLLAGWSDDLHQSTAEEIHRYRDAAKPLDAVDRVLDPVSLDALRDAARRVVVSDEVESYLVRLVRATREHEDLQLGASPRASVALYRASQTSAYLAGRDFVLPDDVAELVVPVLTHRLVVDVDRELRGATAADALAELVGRVPVGVGAGMR